jgi:RNA ligase (TIGR02306 family)
MDSERQLVTQRTVADIQPIPGADNIVCATVDGWKVVVKKGEFAVGDPCVFFEVDSFLPATDDRFAFLAKTKRLWRGKEGYRLKTIKLKGQISQGLALPMSMFPEGLPTAIVEKWEDDVSIQIGGAAKGSFPSFLRKTDQERIQNCFNKIDKNAHYEVTVKMDGTSLTVFNKDGEFGVCSRNQQLKTDEENAGNLYVQQLPSFKDLPEGFAVQAEICGPGIQGNRAGLPSVQTFVFDIFDIKAGEYLTPAARVEMCEKFGWTHAPIIGRGIPEYRGPGNWVGPCAELSSLAEALAFAETFKYPRNNELAEGLVYKRADGKDSFKIISNAFLLKYGL